MRLVVMAAPIVAVVVLATLGILFLRGEQREAEVARFELERFHAVLHAHSTNEWRAIADGKISVELAESIAVHERGLKEFLQTMEHEVVGEPFVKGVEAYLGATRREFRLIELGDVDGAREVDETVVDPTFEQLEELALEAGIELQESAAASARNADRGTIGIAVATLLAFLAQGSRILRIEREAARRDALAAERIERDEERRHAQRMESVGRLAGGIAHDFNNLLTVVTGYGGLVSQELGPDHPCQESIASIIGAADRASWLTRQLLAFGRKQMLAPADIELGGVCEELLPLLRGAVKNDVAVELAVLEQVEVFADARQVGQVVLNLVVNGADAMSDGGRVEIVVGMVDLPEGLRRRGERLAPGRYAQLSVADTGAGMDVETVGRIFEPYFTTKCDGMGLGLSSVAGIVAQSGGLVDVETTPGRGSCFRVYLPLAVGRPEAAGDAFRPGPQAAAA